MLNKQYGVSGLVLSRINNQIFFDHDKIMINKLNLKELKEKVSAKLLTYNLIDKVYLTSAINHIEGGNGHLEDLLRNGHNQKRSGDIVFVFNPSVFKDTPWNKTGTDHHSGMTYDTHVPLLFFGKGIRQGSTFEKIGRAHV